MGGRRRAWEHETYGVQGNFVFIGSHLLLHLVVAVVTIAAVAATHFSLVYLAHVAASLPRRPRRRRSVDSGGRSLGLVLLRVVISNAPGRIGLLTTQQQTDLAFQFCPELVLRRVK